MKKFKEFLQEAGEDKSKFTDAHLASLKKEYSSIKKVDPAAPSYKKLVTLLDKLSQAQLIQLRDAGIPFVSVLAKNRIKK